MIGPRVGAEDLRVLGGQWKANHVRWQLIWGGFPHGPADRGDLAAYDAWIDSELERLDSLLPVCEEVGILVLIDLHTPPGGRNEAKECRLFKEARFQEAFLKVWEKIAARYRDSATVWGYDLVNEPVEGILGEGVMDWHALATEARGGFARSIRNMRSSSRAFWGSLARLSSSNRSTPSASSTVSTCTSRTSSRTRVYDAPVGITYPGEIGGRHWDKEVIRKALRPAIDYRDAITASASTSAPRSATPGSAAHDYLRDVIEVMEENGWDWAYHAFREWDGWSVEHGPDKQSRARSEQPTDRQKLLMSWFEKNERP